MAFIVWKLSLALVCQLLFITFVTAQVSYNGNFRTTVVMEGDSFTIECHTSVYELTEWYKDGSRIPTEDDHYVSVERSIDNKPVNILNVIEAKPEDAGNYRCVKSHEAFHRVIVILGLSNDTETGKPVSFEVTKAFTLDCNVTALPSVENLSVKWYFGDEVVNKTSDHYKFENQTLKVEKPTDSDAGTYACEIQDGKNFTFYVSSQPRITESSGKSMNQVQGDTLTLKCVVAGSPLPRVSWLKDNSPVENDSRISLSGKEGDITFKLTISDLVDEDRAEYTCIADSDGGSVNSTTMVRVKDKLAALWPFLGIVAEVGVLCTIIFIYEKRRTKQEFEESDTDQSPDTKNVADNKEKDVRQRK